MVDFSKLLDGYAPFEELCRCVEKQNMPVSVAGVSESADAQLVYELTNRAQCGGLVLCYTDKEASEFYKNLRFFTDDAAYFPSKEYVFYNIDSRAHDNENVRLKVLSALYKNSNTIVCASVNAVLSYTMDADNFKEHILELKTGEEYNIENLILMLTEMGYTRETMVEGIGQFSVRGGILDVFSSSGSLPIRIEFFDDEIDSIRSFDADSQRTEEMLDSVTIIPCSEIVLNDDARAELIKILEGRIKKAKRSKQNYDAFIKETEADIEHLRERLSFPSIDKYAELIYGRIPTILDYTLNEKGILFAIDAKRVAEQVKAFDKEKAEQISALRLAGFLTADKQNYWSRAEAIATKLQRGRSIAINVLNHISDVKYKSQIYFDTKPIASFHGKIDYLCSDILAWQKDNYTIVLPASSQHKANNLAGVLKERGISARHINKDSKENDDGSVIILTGNLTKGFEYPSLHFVLVCDKEIFEVNDKRERRKLENTKRIKSYNDINVGDYVVHRGQGIGIYNGIKRITSLGVTREYLQVNYAGNDVLYVPVEQLDVLYKYTGGNEDKPPKINKMNSIEWHKTKQRVRKSTDDMAKQLVALYAARQQSEGFAYSEDSPWQREFEDAFPYQETEDQLRSIEEVKLDMEKNRPMDRLLCGDVGYGKTEIALRAAFKAVNNGKQVCYLCPTTILAMQHFNTFSQRMSQFAINVEMLSRFRTPTQQKKIIQKLEAGEIDVVIGTHRVVQDDVKFKDLGLLIIDEEQRFGVKHKERLKELRKNVDVLTMTATPIPRTLHMSMISIRDMSLLTEPPQNRYPVETYVLEHDDGVIASAISRELSRGGQVFYLYNSVMGIYGKAEQIKKNFPEATIAVAHGRMSHNELEDIMYDMVSGRTDILVCTTIIETGLDIPNANTMVIENADRMGLAQLYQLRGRVGRSNRAAYAYFTYKPDKCISEIAQKRLQAIRDFTEFGSGFKIAMRDLEIRGAGNILGAEQHGHMDDIGYDLYCKILEESVKAAKGEIVAEELEVIIDLGVSAYISENYITDSKQRIDMYKKIASIDSDEDKADLEDELIDRYGAFPTITENILEIGALKAKARHLGIAELVCKSGELRLKFERDSVSPQKIIDLDKKRPRSVKLIPTAKPTFVYKLKNEQQVLSETRNLLEFLEI